MCSHRAQADAVPMGMGQASLSSIPWIGPGGGIRDGIGGGIAQSSSEVGNKGVGGPPCHRCSQQVGRRVGGGPGTALGAAPPPWHWVGTRQGGWKHH